MKVTMVFMQSLNGYIATSVSDDLTWGSKQDKSQFAKFTKSIGVIIMGSNSYIAMGSRPLKNRLNIVMTRNPEKFSSTTEEEHLVKDTNIIFTSKSPTQILAYLESKSFSDVAVIGGSKINTLFLKQKLVNEIRVTISPHLIFGNDSIHSFQITDLLPDLVKLDLISTDHIEESGDIINTYKILW